LRGERQPARLLAMMALRRPAAPLPGGRLEARGQVRAVPLRQSASPTTIGKSFKLRRVEAPP
ncbi:hypothetical protein, partial [Massilia eburnea]|uniref:hypothetical protein n=1 Tax=Massilia eburnea TaxID=1776165 RepID=UPI0014797007